MATGFETSCVDYEEYPRNLIYKTSYGGVLKAYAARIETTEPPFLTQDPQEVEIHFRDWNEQTRRFCDHKITGEDSLRAHLGDLTRVDLSTGKLVGSCTTKSDPKCRFIFLHAELSTKPLKITPRLLKRLFTFHQVMPSLIEFLSVFGHPPHMKELGYSGFYDQTVLSPRASTATSTQQPQPNQQQRRANTAQHIVSTAHKRTGPAVASLGRSGRQFQLCYNLKRVARTKGEAGDEVADQRWSIQQNEFYHQFDVEKGTMLFMNAKGRLDDYRDQVRELTGGEGGQPEDLDLSTREERFRSSLMVHLMNCNWANDDWRGYMNYLEEAVEEETRYIVTGPWLSDETTPESLQTAQRYQEKISHASMVIEANIEIMTSLRTFYAGLAKNKDFDMKVQCAEAISMFVQQINDMIHAFQGQKRRAKLLMDITENRKILLLQKLQGRATKKMEDLTTMSYREAIVMKIITAGTFVFLPATFVSTFFSTDVVKFQNTPNGKTSYSSIALERWIEIAIPLTLLTLALGVIAFLLADKRRKRLSSVYDESKKNP